MMWLETNRCFFIVFIFILFLLFFPGCGLNISVAEELKSAYELLNPSTGLSDDINRVSIKLIRFYQRKISPLNGSVCMFYPSCSRFAIEAIRKYGFLAALIMTSERILYREVFDMNGLFLIIKNGLMYNPVYFNYIFKPGDYLNYGEYFIDSKSLENTGSW